MWGCLISDLRSLIFDRIGAGLLQGNLPGAQLPAVAGQAPSGLSVEWREVKTLISDGMMSDL